MALTWSGEFTRGSQHGLNLIDGVWRVRQVNYRMAIRTHWTEVVDRVNGVLPSRGGKRVKMVNFDQPLDATPVHLFCREATHSAY